jgi:GT2 family glycosyltransferase
MRQVAASVVIACHTEERFEMLRRTVASVQAQRPVPVQVIVAVDHNERLCERLHCELSGIDVVRNEGVTGASGTRNAGADAATCEFLVFVDDDVQVRPGWLEALLSPFQHPRVLGSGGMTMAAWESRQPGWFPDEFGWVVGASQPGFPSGHARVRNVWSENMAVRRDAFRAVGGFRVGFGKVGRISRPEDTDLCIRIGANSPDGRWMFVPTAVVDHVVPADRATFRFFLRRCFWEGAGKVELSSHLGADRDLGDERSYLMRTLPLAVARYLADRRLSRAAAILAGVGLAAAGGARSLLQPVICVVSGQGDRS